MATPLKLKFKQRRAVLISGGLDSFHNYSRFLNDLKICYACLVNACKFAASDVQVLYANGGTYDMGGRQVTAQYCDKKNTIAALQKAVKGLQPDDLLVVLTTNHGKATKPHELLLWTVGEKLTSQELGQELAAEPDFHLLGIFGECYGGNMFLDVQTALPAQTEKKCVLLAASTSVSWSLPPDDAYDAFLYYLTTALAGKTPSSYAVNADGNADGHVDIQEAFDHAKAMDNTSDQPDMQDANPPIAARLTLEGMLP
jgi:hypothetical protein